MQLELDKLSTSPKYGPGFYYLNADGQNTFFWPWPQRYYWWKAARFNLSDYIEINGPSKTSVASSVAVRNTTAVIQYSTV